MSTPMEHDHALPAPKAWVLVESMFGNTQAVGAAVVRGLALEGYDAQVVGVLDAPDRLPDDLALLVLGAPTHAFSMSRPNTRADAVRQGASPERATAGMRDWLAACHPGDHPPPVAVFDTRVSKVRRLPMAAGPAARRLAHAKGFAVLDRPAYFLVDDVQGPLASGEVARAAAWGRRLGATCRDWWTSLAAAAS
jgi:hypothetical protein